MPKEKVASWGRLALALVAIGFFAGSGLVWAGPMYPAPRNGSLAGPSSVVHNQVGVYSLSVSFVDGSRGTFNNLPATFSAASSAGPAGNFAGSSSSYLAPAVANPRVILTARYSTTNGSLVVNRLVSVN
jgi:hypothetical protein